MADDSDERKERVLHTRLPPSLDDQLKERARTLGMSVSTIVRHVLLNTFGLVEDVVADSANAALSLGGQTQPVSDGDRSRRRDRGASNGTAASDESVVLAWQEAVLNVNAVCDRCNAILRKGVRAAVGIRERPGARAILCRKCLAKVGSAKER